MLEEGRGYSCPVGLGLRRLEISLPDQTEQYRDSSIRQRLKAKIDQERTNLAFRDDLTGLFNYRLLSHLFVMWWDDLMLKGDYLSLIMLDLDGFKEINDTQGHLIGDEVLRTVSSLFNKHFRKEDIIIRYGGDEFVILLPETTAVEAETICERLRKKISTHAFHSDRDGTTVDLPLSFSFGVANYPNDGQDGETLIELADQKLYEEKRRRKPLLQDVNKSPYNRFRGLSINIVMLLLVGTIVISLVLYFAQPEIRTVQIEAPPIFDRQPNIDPGWIERESALIAKIEELQQQIVILSEQTKSGDSNKDTKAAEQIANLQLEVKGLKTELNEQKKLNSRPSTPIPAGNSAPEITNNKKTPQFAETRPRNVIDSIRTPTPHIEIPVKKIEPPKKYPYAAERLRLEAVIHLRLLIDATGKVVKVEQLGEPIGYGFDEEARRVALKTQFEPGRINGVPVEMEKMITIKFDLDNR